MPPQGCGGCWPDQHLTTAIKDLSHWPRLFSSRYHMGASLISFLTGTALMKLTDALVSVLMLYKNIQVYLKKKFFKRLWEKRAKLPSAQTVPILKTANYPTHRHLTGCNTHCSDYIVKHTVCSTQWKPVGQHFTLSSVLHCNPVVSASLKPVLNWANVCSRT